MSELKLSSVIPYKHTTKDDRELWLIRVPGDFRLESLRNLKVDVDNGGIKKTRISQSDKEFEIHCNRAESAEACQLVGLFPSEKRGELLLTKPFAHQLNVVRHIETPIDGWRLELPAPVPQRANLPGRVMPSGSGHQGIPPPPDSTPGKSSRARHSTTLDTKRDGKKASKAARGEAVEPPPRVDHDAAAAVTASTGKEKRKKAAAAAAAAAVAAETEAAGGEAAEAPRSKKKKSKAAAAAEEQQD